MSFVLLVAILKTANTECENSGSLHGARFFLQINLVFFFRKSDKIHDLFYQLAMS